MSKFALFRGLEDAEISQKQSRLFPFNRASGLGCQVEQNAVDALYFGGDAGHDLVENGVGDLFNGGGHCVLGIHGADDGRPAFVAALVLHTNTLKIDCLLDYLRMYSSDLSSGSRHIVMGLILRKHSRRAR